MSETTREPLVSLPPPPGQSVALLPDYLKKAIEDSTRCAPVTDLLARWFSQPYPQEINSGAVSPDVKHPGQWIIEANTAAGSRKFEGATEATGLDPQSEPQRDSGRFLIKNPYTDVWFSDVFDADLRVVPDDSLVEEPPDDIPVEQPPSDPASLLEQLRTATTDAGTRRSVIEAEVVEFTAAQETQLAELLWGFVQAKRDSQQPDDIVAVASAIRKLVATMNVNDLDRVNLLLDPIHRAVLPVELELEIVKMIARKFTANPPATPNPQPLLAATIRDILHAYVQPRILPRQKYRVIALNAFVALVAMRSDHAESALVEVNAVPFQWFREHARKRLWNLAKHWETLRPELASEHLSNVRRITEGVKTR